MNDETIIPGEPLGEPKAAPEGLRRPFPFEHMLYALGFAIVAWLVFWLTICLAVLQYIVTAILGRKNEELTKFSHGIALYLEQLLLYVLLVRSERPFPFAAFPKP